MGSINKISVFFPAYNEEENIENTVKKAVKVLNDKFDQWEIIIVNDGSTDSTGKIADKLSSKNKNISVIHHSPNRGYGGAFKSGLYASRYPWITFTDSDGQFDFSEITKFIDKQKKTKADIVVGYYKKRQVKKSVIITSKMWEFLVYLLFKLHVRDIDCGFKLIRKEVIDKIPKLESERGAFISSELLIKAKQNGAKIVEIPVSHYPRVGGKPTGRNLNVIMQSFKDLFTLWRRYKHGEN